MTTLAEEIRESMIHAPRKPLNGFNPQRYMGTMHPYLGINTKSKEDIARSFFLKHQKISFEELTHIVTDLMKGSSFEEKTLGPFLLNSYKQYAALLSPNLIERWLYELEGWCEIDTLCQNRLNETLLLMNWDLWNKDLTRFAKHSNINHRRASLVLLCKPLRQTTDERVYELAIQNIQILTYEKNILITKAISWVLRECTKQFRENVIRFIRENSHSLPAIAIRETKRKLSTGKK